MSDFLIFFSFLWAFMGADDINDRMISCSLNYWKHDISNGLVPEVIIFFYDQFFTPV